MPDYSALDRPEVLAIAFHPRSDWNSPPAAAKDYMIPVERDISISARFFPAGSGTNPSTGNTAPCILLFHGNGEVACDYDWVAPSYNRLGMSLFVADYRGYGRSGGMPTFSSMIQDAGAIASFFLETMRLQEQRGPLVLMGRSLGAASALEIAFHQQTSFSGIIIESGSANFIRVLSHHGLLLDSKQTSPLTAGLLKEVSSITLPALIIHGGQDMLVPPKEGRRLYAELGSKTKRLVIIAGAGHNDIMVSGALEYFAAVSEFVGTQPDNSKTQ